MPFPVRASLTSIGTAGESSFHAALDGFGYKVESTEKTPPASLPPQLPMPPAENFGPRGWVNTLSTLEPSLAPKLIAVGIWDEDSYLLRESDLDLDTRCVTGQRRYEILEGEHPNADSLLDNLNSAPPWLLSTPISLLNLTVRSSNVCASHEINKVGDFAKYGLKGLYKLPNLGQKSIHEISREIVHALTTGHPLKTFERNIESATHDKLVDALSHSNADTDDSDADYGNQTGYHAVLSSNLTTGFREVAQILAQNERGVWAARLGFRCEPMTLQQISDQIGVTRERIRQIEARIYKKVQRHPFWDELSRRVNEHLRGRTSPLFLSGLSAIDPWFEGADLLSHTLREVSDHIPRLGFHIITWNDLPVISAMSHSEWLAAIDEAKSLLMAIADQNLCERDALSHAAGVLIGKGEDMREALNEEVSRFFVWSTLPDGSRILTGFGKSVAALVSGVLQASEVPLHIDEIHVRVRAHSTYEATSIPYIRSAASEVGILYGRSTYGLIKHCPLNPAQMIAIRAEVEDIISGGSSSKQWHSSELYDELLNRGFSYEGRLTKYIINIALSKSANLVYLRRMIWGVRGQWNETSEARLDVKQAIVSLLEEEGKPMSTTQIRSKLIEGRGLNIHFQIWSSSPLVKLGPGLWGLEGRDLDMDHSRALAYRLLKELSARQEGMHVSEVAAFLGMGSDADVSMLVSIAAKDGLRMDRGQYCYLQPWGESRRISIWEAATSTLKSHPNGLPRGELQLFVERIAKRKVDRQQLSSILQNIDAIYDSKSNLWKFTGLTEEEDENDSEASTPLLHS
jgi:hypothetical protein